MMQHHSKYRGSGGSSRGSSPVTTAKRSLSITNGPTKSAKYSPSGSGSASSGSSPSASSSLETGTCSTCVSEAASGSGGTTYNTRSSNHHQHHHKHHQLAPPTATAAVLHSNSNSPTHTTTGSYSYSSHSPTRSSASYSTRSSAASSSYYSSSSSSASSSPNTSIQSCSSSSSFTSTGSSSSLSSTPTSYYSRTSASSYTSTSRSGSSGSGLSSSASASSSPNTSFSSSIEEIKSEEFVVAANKPPAQKKSQRELNAELEVAKKGARICMWNKCSFRIEPQQHQRMNSSGSSCNESVYKMDEFIDHIKSKHIYSQKDQSRYRCLWQGCQVYKIPSCSFNWLERHVMDHIDSKPFVCIFRGCKRRFRTVQARERHAQMHINQQQAATAVGTAAAQVAAQLSPAKQSRGVVHATSLLKSSVALLQNLKNNRSKKAHVDANIIQMGHKHPHKKQKALPSIAPNYAQILRNLARKRRMQSNTELAKKFRKAQYKDYIDPCTTDVLRHKLATLNYAHGDAGGDSGCGSVTLKAQIVACQSDPVTGIESYLVEWFPKNIIDNEWVEKDKLCGTKSVELSHLSFKRTHGLNSTHPFYKQHRYRANKRK